MERFNNDGLMRCDVEGCENVATCNYQDAFIKWTIDEKGDYCDKEEMEIITAGDETNKHLCDDHDTDEHFA